MTVIGSAVVEMGRWGLSGLGHVEYVLYWCAHDHLCYARQALHWEGPQVSEGEVVG